MPKRKYTEPVTIVLRDIEKKRRTKRHVCVNREGCEEECLRAKSGTTIVVTGTDVEVRVYTNGYQHIDGDFSRCRKSK